LRRRRHERQAAAQAAIETAVVPNLSRSDDEAIVAEEIARLPEKYRGPTVLCYLQEMSYEAAASCLGLTEDTVRGRLARARDRLRSRLTGRGVHFSSILGARRLAIPALNTVRPALVNSTTQAVMNVVLPNAMERFLTYNTVVSVSERIGMTMMRNKLRTAILTTLTLGVIAAGAVVVAQPAGGGRDQPVGPAGAPRPAAPVTGSNGGNLIVDWTPAGSKSGKIEITVDATRHCVHLAEVSLKRNARPNDGAVRLDLERGKTYTVTATGEAFMTDSTGPDADPFPGVVLIYGTDEEDGFAIRQAILAPGKSITFKTPWRISPEDEVGLMAFFLDISPETTKRGSYTLIVTHAEPNTTKLFNKGVDFSEPTTSALRGRDGSLPLSGAGSGMR
jgi:Sigma-70, region 4